MSEEKRNTRITGLALSGGGARGYAHLGIMEALNRRGIYPDMISGTSAGAIAGVLYADGYRPKEILEILGRNSKLDFLKPAVPKYGLLRMSGMTALLEETLRAKTFEELKISLFVTATNLNRGKAEYFSSGELIPAIIASASIPVIFRPVIMNNYYYVDGGVLDNLPVSPLESQCNFLIGSYVNFMGETEHFTTMVGVAERAFHLSITKDLTYKKRKFNIYIEPPGLDRYGAFDQEKAFELYDLGYRTALEKIDAYYSTME
jgi:NTE family protein